MLLIWIIACEVFPEAQREHFYAKKKVKKKKNIITMA